MAGNIASQSEIDRVNRALGGMNRGPDERLKVYQRAKAKFSKLMAWNSDELAAMADTGSDDSQIRRTQILQALGELDGCQRSLQNAPPVVTSKCTTFDGCFFRFFGFVLARGFSVPPRGGVRGTVVPWLW